MRILILLLVALPLCAQHVPQSKWRKAFNVSQVVLVGATIADSHSSFNHPELNPALRSQGRFRWKGVAIKCGVVAAVVGIQRLVNRKGLYNKPLAVGNFVVGGFTAGVAVRNYRLFRSPRAGLTHIQSRP